MNGVEKWQVLRILKPDFIGELVGVSGSSVRRYLSGKRVSPEETAARLDHIAAVVRELRYWLTEEGVRIWFDWANSRYLYAFSPYKFLAGGQWSPEDSWAQLVLDAAISGRSSDAT